MAQDRLFDASVAEFLDRLASDAPTPGGGAAAALVGAISAALGQMACALTLGKPKFAEREAEVQPLASRLRRAALMLRELVEEDAAAYEALSQALKLDRNHPDRAARVARAAELAAGVPLETVAVTRQVLADLRRLTDLANPSLRCDLQAALHLAGAAMQAAAENVRANLPLLPPEQRARVERELSALLGAD